MQPWLAYALAACVTYTALSACIVLFTKRHMPPDQPLVPFALALLIAAGALAAAAMIGTPSLRLEIPSTTSIVSIAAAIVLMGGLIVLTHVCVYTAIVKAPNAGYAQAVVNVSALLLAIVMWWLGQPLSATAAAGIVFIVVGSGLLKV